MALAAFRTANVLNAFWSPTYLKSFHSSTISQLPRWQSKTPKAKVANPLTLEDALEGTKLEYEGDDTTSAGHIVLREQRKLLYYLRLIEHEMPKLVGECPACQCSTSTC
jgi:small subunit ribosomal protein S35